MKQQQLNLFLEVAAEARDAEMRSIAEDILDKLEADLDRRGVDREYFLLEWKLKEILELLAQFPEQKRQYFAVRLCESVFPE